MTTEDATLCSAYDQISDRKCRYYADHGGKHNFARLDHDSSLERELRRALDDMTKILEEALVEGVQRIESIAREDQAFLEGALRLVDAEWRARLTKALDLFDANWCPAHGHAPTAEAFEKAADLSKLAGRDAGFYDDLIGTAGLRRPR